MRNPFVMAKLMAAHLALLTRDAVRGLPHDDESRLTIPALPGGRGRGSPGPRNPAGSKIIRRFYRNKFGAKANYKTACDWHRAQRVTQSPNR